MSPQTVQEWLEYIYALDDEDLLLKAIGANDATFVRALEEEGFTHEEISLILKTFASRMVDAEIPFPNMPDQFFSYASLLEPA
jgi:hypothetical protein